jgi:alkylation response protein AidB-like acyl-CoA dehydrogenase
VEYLTCQQVATDAQREQFLPAFAANPIGLAAGVLTEPDAGTDNLLPYDRPGAGLQMSVVDDGDHYVLNGVKQFISEGGAASVYFVYARTDPAVGLLDGTSVFIVPGDTPGITHEVHDKSGGRLSFNARLRFDDCQVPHANLFGPWNTGLRALREHAGSYEFIINAARCVGLARACYEAALEHARTRVQGGGPIFNHDLVADSLVESFVAIEAARTLTWRAAWAADHRDTEADFVRLGKAAALLAQDMVIKVALRAQETFGAYGIMRGSRIEKLVRDALTCLAFEGGQNPKRLQLQALL